MGNVVGLTGSLMKNPLHSLAIAAAVLTLASLSSFAKDEPVDFNACPPAVQNVIKQYSAHATFEKVELDEKKKSGGPAVYEAKFALKDGRRIEVHISPDGKIVAVENKQPKQ